MSFNIGERNSRFVAVSNVTMRYDFSEKVLFADLRTSRKTGRPKTDESGEVVIDEKGRPVDERVFTFWEGRFVGNAFEPAKALKKGQMINIVNGWLDKEVWTGSDGKKRERVFAVITDFTLSNSAYGEQDEDEQSDDRSADGDDARRDAFRSLNGDGDTPFNGGRV